MEVILTPLEYLFSLTTKFLIFQSFQFPSSLPRMLFLSVPKQIVKQNAAMELWTHCCMENTERWPLPCTNIT